eukprot:g10278.t1
MESTPRHKLGGRCVRQGTVSGLLSICVVFFPLGEHGVWGAGYAPIFKATGPEDYGRTPAPQLITDGRPEAEAQPERPVEVKAFGPSDQELVREMKDELLLASGSAIAGPVDAWSKYVSWRRELKASCIRLNTLFRVAASEPDPEDPLDGGMFNAGCFSTSTTYEDDKNDCLTGGSFGGYDPPPNKHNQLYQIQFQEQGVAGAAPAPPWPRDFQPATPPDFPAWMDVVRRYWGARFRVSTQLAQELNDTSALNELQPVADAVHAFAGLSGTMSEQQQQATFIFARHNRLSVVDPEHLESAAPSTAAPSSALAAGTSASSALLPSIEEFCFFSLVKKSITVPKNKNATSGADFTFGDFDENTEMEKLDVFEGDAAASEE